MARLKEFYKSDVAPAMMSKFGYKSVMQIPKLDKVVINVGCGELKDNPKMLDAIVSDLGKITGQKAMPCKAHKSVANFKLREGMVIGAKVTLRGERMYEFVPKSTMCVATGRSVLPTSMPLTISTLRISTVWVCLPRQTARWSITMMPSSAFSASFGCSQTTTMHWQAWLALR